MSEDAHHHAATIAASHEALVQEAYDLGARHVALAVRDICATADDFELWPRLKVLIDRHLGAES